MRQGRNEHLMHRLFETTDRLCANDMLCSVSDRLLIAFVQDFDSDILFFFANGDALHNCIQMNTITGDLLEKGSFEEVVEALAKENLLVFVLGVFG